MLYSFKCLHDLSFTCSTQKQLLNNFAEFGQNGRDHKKESICKRASSYASTGKLTNRPKSYKFCVFPEVPQARNQLYSCLLTSLVLCSEFDCSWSSHCSACQMRDIPLSLSLHSSSPPVLPVISVAAGDIWTTVTVDTVGWRALTNPHGQQKTGGEDSHWWWWTVCVSVCVFEAVCVRALGVYCIGVCKMMVRLIVPVTGI